jgi:hypothetical protein
VMVIAIGHLLGGGYLRCRRYARGNPDRRRQHGDRQADKNGKNGSANAHRFLGIRQNVKGGICEFNCYVAANMVLML